MVLGDFPHNIVSRFARRDSLLTDIREHQRLWESTEITHYQITIKNQGYTSYWLICNSAMVEVRNGEIVHIEGAGEDAQWCRGVYDDLTVEGLFRLARKYVLRNDPIRVRINSVEYDEGFGFIDHLSISVTPTFVDPYIYGDRYLATIEPEYFEVWLTDFQPLD
jgi:hypothetical protein